MVSENSEHDNLLVESAVTCACSSHWKDTNDDVNLLMLRAIEPPDHSDMTLPGKHTQRSTISSEMSEPFAL